MVLAALVEPVLAAPPVNRWGLEYNRPTRVPRASDPFVHKPPVRVYRKPKPEPVEPAEVPPLPKYGKPKPAIERIPGT
ncbi:hypothetical protein IZ6_19660 [Terrihabitans soli]|uniref:Uncharacterized protein n=2 Tax=Terrihabitans soli TaxID=708113 RepID=A0A6S6QW00_9HYPH|nr:hypothetical protein IZ6_19660 [Terrihabitans soli]